MIGGYYMIDASGHPSDEAIIQQLGAAVLLCWHELSFVSQGQILAQASDMIGVMPMSNARDKSLDCCCAARLVLGKITIVSEKHNA